MCGGSLRSADEKKKLGLKPDGFASQVKYVSEFAKVRKTHDLRMGDVIVSVDANLESETDKNMFLAKVRGLLGSMPADQRRTLELAFFEGLTHSEVAEKMGEPLGTVKTRIRTGLMAMRKALGN